MPIFKQNTEIKSIKKGTQNIKEVYRGTTLVWQLFSPIVATGGSISDVDIGGVNYRIHAFTSTGTSTFTVTDVGVQNNGIDLLVVAGGGGGASGGNGGGGAGGLVEKTNYTVTNTNYSIQIGQGGFGASGTNLGGGVGQNSFFDNIVALGGGRGLGDSDSENGDGGSGGGATRYQTTFGIGLQPNSSAGGFGNNGGDTSPSNAAAGGGGGAGQAGQTATNSKCGDGGDGRNLSSIFGTSYGENGYFAGGGGGSVRTDDFPNAAQGIGGLGGGGNGAYNGQVNGELGTPNTGGGGGAGRYDGIMRDGGQGGSGIVLIRYRLDPPS